MRPHRALILLLAAHGCGKGLDQIGSFPCARDGTCPGGYTCVGASSSSAGTCTSGVSGSVIVTISPKTATIAVNTTQAFNATVTGSSNTMVTFSVSESGGGSVTSGGVYTASSTAGTYHVVATAAADAGRSDTATVTVTSSATCNAGNQVFSATDADQSFIVPAGCTAVTVKLWGGGGGGADSTYGSGSGGGGGFTTGTSAVTPGETLTVIVGNGGMAGSHASPVHATYGGGGGVYLLGSGTNEDHDGAAGGGRSALRRGSADLLVAGGGAGALRSADGAAGGGSSGLASSASFSGGPGTQVAGGASGGAEATAGTPGAGGAGGGCGSGGGGGYFGGGGGGACGPGGGGSGYVGGTGVTSASTTAGTGASGAGTSDSDYVAGIAVGGTTNQAGGAGRIVLHWGQPAASCLAAKTAGGTTDGVYTLNAGGQTFQAYCDMTTNDGGWTLVAGIDGTNNNHANTADVTSANLVTVSGKGKFSDAIINALESGTNPAYRLTCGSTTGFFAAACTFAATTVAAGACTGESYTYPPTSYGTTHHSQSVPPVVGLADGDQGDNNRLTYGSTQNDPSDRGCNTGTAWNSSGTLWVR